jgi:lipopolysaccharide transport system permease protein
MRSLTRDTVFPKEILVMSSVIANSIEFVISLLICIALAYLTGIKLSWASSMPPLILLLQMMLVLWVSFILACCYVFVKDIGHIYQVFLRLLLFITPIFYGTSFLGEGIAKHIVSFNPLMYLINFSRLVIIDGEFFPARSFFIFGLLNALLICLGVQIFRKCEAVFAERI